MYRPVSLMRPIHHRTSDILAFRTCRCHAQHKTNFLDSKLYHYNSLYFCPCLRPVDPGLSCSQNLIETSRGINRILKERWTIPEDFEVFFSIMVLFTPSYNLLFFILCIFGQFMDMAQSCDKDAHCKPHQVCCGKRCRSWPKCFLNSDKECYYDTHCIKGAVCVFNVCKPRKLLPTSCKTDEDCSFQKHSKSYDGIVSTSKCCQGKCFKTKSCLALKINSTLTTPATSRAIGEQPCLETTNCPSELECINTRCTVKKVVDSQKKSKESDTTLSRAGFLSAAILTAAVFLTIMCFCFLKETKYAQRHYMHRARRGESLTQSTYSTAVDEPSVLHDQLDQTHSSNSRNNNRPLQITASWILFPGLYGLNQTERSHGAQDRDCEQQEDCNSSCTRPPSYRSVCLEHELPPSYDEAVNCYCQNYEHNIAITTTSNIQSDQQSASLA